MDPLIVSIRTCFGFCPALSRGDEHEAHRSVLFHLTPSNLSGGEAVAEVPKEDCDAQTNLVGICTALLYLGEGFGLTGATRQTMVRERGVVCLHSPLPDLWVGLIVDRALESECALVHDLLERSFEVFRMRHGAVAVASLCTPDCETATRDLLRVFYARFLDYLNSCVLPRSAASGERKRTTFCYPTPSWYTVAAFDALLGYTPLRFGGLNDTPRLALRCHTIAFQHMARYLGWPMAAALPHYALFDFTHLRLLSSSLPARVLAVLRLHWLLEERLGVASRLFLPLDARGGARAEVCMEVLMTHVSPTAVLVLMRASTTSPPSTQERDAAFSCARAITADVAELLKPLAPLSSLRTIPLVVDGQADGSPTRSPASVVYTGPDTFWLQWDDEGLQGCALAELHVSVARHVARLMRLVRREDADVGEWDVEDEGEVGAGGGPEGELEQSVYELVGTAGLVFAGRRRGDGAVLAVLVTDMPSLPTRFARVAAVRATLGF